MGFKGQIIRMLPARLSPAAVKLWLLRLMVRWPRLCSLHYLIKSHFSRNHYAVFYGRYLHLSQLEKLDDAGSVYNLRRNTHRLKKALIMRPRHETFARDYITEPGDCCDWVTTAVTFQDIEVSRRLTDWTSDMLNRYFNTIEPGLNAIVDNARMHYEDVHHPIR